MLTRRQIFPLIGFAPAILWGRRARAADPAGFVRQVGDQLVGVINGPGAMTDKRAQLRQIIDRFVDVDGIGRFCLGRFWRVATPSQQRDYLALFHQVLVTSISGHLGEYKGVRYTLGRVSPHDDTVWVDTTIFRPNNPQADVQWVLTTIDGSPRIEDLVVEGTSLRLTQRSDYTSFLQHNGDNVQALIEAMRRTLTRASQG